MARLDLRASAVTWLMCKYYLVHNYGTEEESYVRRESYAMVHADGAARRDSKRPDRLKTSKRHE